MAEYNEYSEKIKDRKFQNWVKANLATNITTEGIREFVLETVTNFHGKSFDDVKRETGVHFCSECSRAQILPCFTKNICVRKSGICELHSSLLYRPCPNDVCHRIRDKIRAAHLFKYPNWKNSLPENWCTNAWELAKCYMPDGYSAVTGIADTDLNGIISVVLNHQDFNLTSKEEVCKKLRTTTNDLRHSPDVFIEEAKLNEHIANLIGFLKNIGDSKATEATKRIVKLMDEPLPISKSVEMEDVEKASRQASQKQLTDIILQQVLSKFQSAYEISQNAKRPPMSEDLYQKLKKDMKEDLVVYNKHNHSTLPVSPLIEEHETSLEELYVPPRIETTDVQNTAVRNSWTEPGSLITSFQDIFYCKTKATRFREIYLTSGAGMGKTAFCKYLVMKWCQIKKTEESQTVSDLDSITMKGFEYVFLIPLRETCRLHCSIGDMIYHQIIKHLSRSHDYPKELLLDILHREECLVILDGLDEWKHPSTSKCCCHSLADSPHRKIREHCTILSTTRPWKLSVLKLKSNQIDKHVRITELGKSSTEQLIRNSVLKLNASPNDVDSCVQNFNKDVEKKSIQHLQSFPLVLTYLICLWFKGYTFGDSRCQIYSDLIGLHLSKAEERCHTHQIRPPNARKRKIDMPEAIMKNCFCEKYYSFLKQLGHLAFETYVDNNNREFSLVFDSYLAQRRLGPDYLKFGLSSGLLTQHRIKGQYMTRRYRMAFAHKTFQEFLAALYLYTVPFKSPMMERIKQLCNSLENVLTIFDFLTFLSGLCPKKTMLLLRELHPVIAASHLTAGYRSDMDSWNYFVGYNETMKKVQNLHVACVEECEDNTNEFLNIEVEDFIIDSDYKTKKYSSVLRRLITNNKQRVKSIKVRDIRTKGGFQEISAMLKCNATQSLEKIDLKCNFSEEDLDALLENSEDNLKCFVIKGGQWNNSMWTHNYINLSNESYKVLQNLKCLEKLYLRNIQMGHKQLECLFGSISNRPLMKQIGLKNIRCDSHTECNGVNFDLSSHASLQFLELDEVPVSDVKINTSSLEICYVGKFPSRGILSSVLGCLQTAESLHRFYCGFLSSTEDVIELLETVPKLVNTEYIWLTSINVDKNKILLSPKMVKLEKIIMMSGNLGSDVLRHLFQQAIAMTQPVTVGLFDVVITPEYEKEIVKDEIKKSNSIILLLDGKDGNGQEEFLFKTVHKDKRVM